MEDEYIGREEFNQVRRLYAEQAKNILLQLETVKRTMAAFGPKPQLAPPMKDALDKQVQNTLKKIGFLETEVLNIKKKLNMI